MSGSNDYLTDRGLVASPPSLDVGQPAALPTHLRTWDLPPDYEARVLALELSIRNSESLRRTGSMAGMAEHTLQNAYNFHAFLIARNKNEDNDGNTHVD